MNISEYFSSQLVNKSMSLMEVLGILAEFNYWFGLSMNLLLLYLVAFKTRMQIVRRRASSVFVGRCRFYHNRHRRLQFPLPILVCDGVRNQTVISCEITHLQ
ncbi:hypothetical protein PFISCL1PPCAC_13999 [Pristionchus fissidentatus]|uniref:G protein-coupled receptor n=1 Tax=Pristionchus fissidentatus TaxID=1538716 RepID=A0AAV5VSN5_9BILA|nr:hypothetical protein PFISCL1PPCAC_13999 [Pristionchus fissidentatus]